MQKQMRKFFFLRKANKKVGARLATYWGHRGPPSYPPRSAWWRLGELLQQCLWALKQTIRSIHSSGTTSILIDWINSAQNEGTVTKKANLQSNGSLRHYYILAPYLHVKLPGSLIKLFVLLIWFTISGFKANCSSFIHTAFKNGTWILE